MTSKFVTFFSNERHQEKNATTYQDLRIKILITQIYFNTRDSFYGRNSFKYSYQDISEAVQRLSEEQAFDIYSRMIVLYEKLEFALEEEIRNALSKFYTYLCKEVLKINVQNPDDKGQQYGYYATENFFSTLPH